MQRCHYQGGIMGKDTLTLAMSGVFTLIMHTHMNTQDVNRRWRTEGFLHGQTVRAAVSGNAQFQKLWAVRFWVAVKLEGKRHRCVICDLEQLFLFFSHTHGGIQCGFKMVCLSIYLSIVLSFYLSFYLSLYISIYRSVYHSIYCSVIYRSLHHSIVLSF